jgi:hypothetical protein
VNHVKAEIIAGAKDPAVRKALESFPGRYFQVAAETVDDPDDRIAVLWRVVELYNECVEQTERRRVAAEAKLAEQRRAHLRIVDSEPPERPADFSYQVPTKGAS